MDLSWGEKNETSTLILNLILKVSMFSHYDLNLGLIKGDFPCDNSCFFFFFFYCFYLVILENISDAEQSKTRNFCTHHPD